MEDLAKIDEGAAAVGRRELALLNLLRDELDLVLVRLEHLKGLLLRQGETLKGLLLLKRRLKKRMDKRKDVGVSKGEEL